jgi:hypothetical protein
MLTNSVSNAASAGSKTLANPTAGVIEVVKSSVYD